MTDTPASGDPDLEPAATLFSEAAVPWLEGALLRYLAAGSVLDIKSPDDSNGGPVVPRATVATLAPQDGTDGGLPPSMEWYDAVFSRGALTVAENPRTVLAAWFERVRPNGYLVIVLPQAEALFGQPSLGRDDPVVTAEALMQTVEGALPAGSFRVLHLDAAPVRSLAGSAAAAAIEIRLVLRALERRSSQSASPAAVTVPLVGAADSARAVAEAVIPFALPTSHPLKAPGMRAEGGLLIRDFAPRPAKVGRILVLKLDHLGDFIIGLPALRELRQAFPDAHIRLVCGRWNAASARASGVVDEARCFDYFPERAVDCDGTLPPANWEQFAAATEGRFDIAIDLRVDEDTRGLLARVDAEMRCGIGSQARFPMLDIALPEASRQPIRGAVSSVRNASGSPDGSQTLKPDAFNSTMEIKTLSFHESSLASTERCLLRSRNVVLSPGRYRAKFDLSARGFVPSLHSFGVNIEVIANGEHRIASKVFGRRSIWGLNSRQATLEFDSSAESSSYDFRVHASGKALAGRLRFSGVDLLRLEAGLARFLPSELHVGEKLSLLVGLIRSRTCGLPADPPAPVGGNRPFQPDRPMQIVVAPFSNSSVRDWPIGRYAELIGLLTKQFDCHVTVVGTAAQAAQAATLIDLLPGDVGRGRVSDRVGKTSWSDLPDILRAADLVICNNSGIAHQSASLGTRTLAIYSGSHQPLEWGPRGRHARAIMASVPCSPCGYERLEDCANNHLCMLLITPQAVIAQVTRVLEDSDEHPTTPAGSISVKIPNST